MKRISIEPSFAAWRHAARELLRQRIEPAALQWEECGASVAVLSDRQMAGPVAGAAAGHAGNHAAGPAAPAIPRELLNRLKAAACFHAPDRWALLYRVLWRWTHDDRRVAGLDDPDGALLAHRAQTVERETAELRALTRFRRRDPSMGLPEFVGWRDTRHDLLERAADLFAGPMGESTWMLATPHGAVFWNGMLLHVGQTTPGHGDAIAQARQDAAAGAMTGEALTSASAEALWLAYFATASVDGDAPASVSLRYWRIPPAGPPLPAHLARERCRADAQSAVVRVPPPPPLAYSAMTPPLREPAGPLATCRRCALWRNAHQAVAGSGPAHATIMTVGEQPGEYENRHGTPFTGEAGPLLDIVLQRAGLERDQLYLTYAVKHYKWGAPDQPLQRQAGWQRVHRVPEPREVEACQYWLAQELSQVAPRVVVTLGATALKALTGPHVNLSEYLGRTIVHDDRLIVPTWHPTYALRTADPGLREDIIAAIVTAFRHAAALAAQPMASDPAPPVTASEGEPIREAAPLRR